jgi:hypothetical protein
MKARPVTFLFLSFSIFLILAASLTRTTGSAAEEIGERQVTETHTTLELKGEHRDVGLKRMEILEKSLSPELLTKKRAFVRSREQEYNEKIGILLQRLTTPIGRNTVITHIDVDFFALDFEPRIQATENVTVTVLLDEDGLAKWASGRGSQEEAVEDMQALIHGAFKIPLEQIKIVVTPN